jgi:hypothetical protein
MKEPLKVVQFTEYTPINGNEKQGLSSQYHPQISRWNQPLECADQTAFLAYKHMVLCAQPKIAESWTTPQNFK